MLVPCLDQARERRRIEVLEIGSPKLGGERRAGRDHLDCAGGSAPHGCRVGA
jgi:hypothetical protein